MLSQSHLFLHLENLKPETKVPFLKVEVSGGGKS